MRVLQCYSSLVWKATKSRTLFPIASANGDDENMNLLSEHGEGLL